MKHEVATINFTVYEDDTRFVGIGSAKLPDIVQKTITYNGVGIAGDVLIPLSGQLDAMTLTLNFKTYSPQIVNLRSPGSHKITLLPAVQVEDTVAGELIAVAEKHVFKANPIGLTGPELAPANERNSTFTAAVLYWAFYNDNKLIHEIDVMNSIFIINGTDYGKPVRKALGL